MNRQTTPESEDRIKARRYECFIEDHEEKTWSPGLPANWCANLGERNEIGDTLVTDMLDAAVTRAIENGDLGFEFEDEQ